jgi:hypothetical protein
MLYGAGLKTVRIGMETKADWQPSKLCRSHLCRRASNGTPDQASRTRDFLL